MGELAAPQTGCLKKPPFVPRWLAVSQAEVCCISAIFTAALEANDEILIKNLKLPTTLNRTEDSSYSTLDEMATPKDRRSCFGER